VVHATQEEEEEDSTWLYNINVTLQNLGSIKIDPVSVVLYIKATFARIVTLV